MKIYCKWAFALMPLLLVGCKDEIDQPQGPVANSGDDVQFMIAADAQSRTVYSEPWAETGTNDIYWGNYVTTEKEYVNIYCPDNPSRGFARYEITARTEGDMSSAASISKTTTVGVQWGESGKPYTFYAFYPADKASTTLENGNTIRATVETGQNARSYKVRENTSTAAPTELSSLSQYYTDEWKDYSAANQYVNSPAKTIFGMPDMRAAVMVANTTMPADKFGEDVPLDFKVLADVIDITLNGPVTPNTLGGNASGEEAGKQREYIRIQTVSLEVVNTTGNDINGDPITDKTEIKNLPIDNDAHISGSFDLDMSKVPAITAAVASGGDAQAAVAAAVTNVSGPASVQLQLGTSDGSAVSYPVLFTRPGGNVPAGQTADVNELDHLRLRAFIVPGQINSTNMNKLRVHIQTDCGDYYQMLEKDTQFVTGQIYPVKLGYFRQEGAEFDYSRWIGQLDPNIYITELSIPGAWHALSTDNQGSVTYKELYNAGIRAFEVHTINGTVPFTDSQFGTQLTTSNVLDKDREFYTDKLDEKDYTVNTPTVSGGTQNFWRTEITGATVTQTRTKTYTLMPKFALRMYRSKNITNSTMNPDESFSDAVIDLASVMNKDGLMFLEFGYERGYNGGIQRPVSVPCKLITITEERIKTNQTLTRTTAFQDWNTDNVFSDSDPWGEPKTSESATTYTLDDQSAWPIAVESCLKRLTTAGIVYADAAGITNNTTISDVQGKVIIKINTNNDNNERIGIGWSGNTPALFSRWMGSDYADKPLTINLQWGKPIQPLSNGTTGSITTDLRWCFSELDAVNSATLLEARKNAIIAMNDEAAKNYADGNHDTFYETSIGGFYINNNAQGCQDLAKELNPYALARISNPTRQAVPLGLVFMNYAISPDEDTYHSAALIRAIINNNRAFLLNRRGSKKVGDETNANYMANPKNPLKP